MRLLLAISVLLIPMQVSANTLINLPFSPTSAGPEAITIAGITGTGPFPNSLYAPVYFVGFPQLPAPTTDPGSAVAYSITVDVFAASTSFLPSGRASACDENLIAAYCGRGLPGPLPVAISASEDTFSTSTDLLLDSGGLLSQLTLVIDLPDGAYIVTPLPGGLLLFASGLIGLGLLTARRRSR